jgi:hypothetical protein
LQAGAPNKISLALALLFRRILSVSARDPANADIAKPSRLPLLLSPICDELIVAMLIEAIYCHAPGFSAPNLLHQETVNRVRWRRKQRIVGSGSNED